MVKSGEFEVLERRQGINMRVNRKARGDCFGEVSLMYSCPRSATVAALQDSVVWVLERQIFRCGCAAPMTASSNDEPSPSRPECHMRHLFLVQLVDVAGHQWEVHVPSGLGIEGLH